MVMLLMSYTKAPFRRVRFCKDRITVPTVILPAPSGGGPALPGDLRVGRGPPPKLKDSISNLTPTTLQPDGQT